MLENTRASFDLTSRASYFEREDEVTFQHFVGMEIFKVFHSGNQDIGQLLVQPFIHRIDNGVRTPGYYDDNHDTEFIWRTVTFTYTGLGYHMPWIKIGHFEVPFGVEYTKNTFGNLHQYGQTRKLGLKMDWGLAIGQELTYWQYELSTTRGSGLKYRDKDNPSAYSGRISTLNNEDWVAGLSFFAGDILKNKETFKRQLISLDIEYAFEQFSLITEVYSGEHEKDNIYGGLLEINWRSKDEQAEIYTQFQHQDIQRQNDYSAISIGTKSRISCELELSLQMTFEIDRAPEETRSSIFEFQMRYLF
ncbi:MAG: hypothetical protein MK132_19895 [Lentisphaerales bacterium]|nr:hypothetical protein [Lentisphaerales bacterium]